jgi:hypothetical protein
VTVPTSMRRRTTLSRLFRVLFVLIAICAVWLAVAFFEYLHERKLAKAAVQTVGELQVGYSTQGQAEALLTPYAKFRVQGLENGIQLLPIVSVPGATAQTRRHHAAHPTFRGEAALGAILQPPQDHLRRRSSVALLRHGHSRRPRGARRTTLTRLAIQPGLLQVHDILQGCARSARRSSSIDSHPAF